MLSFFIKLNLSYLHKIAIAGNSITSFRNYLFRNLTGFIYVLNW